MYSPSQRRTYGGTGTQSSSPYRTPGIPAAAFRMRNQPPSPSPQRTAAPTAADTSPDNPAGRGSPVPIATTSPMRYRIANPDPPPEEAQMRTTPLQQQAARSFGLRPTHSMAGGAASPPGAGTSRPSQHTATSFAAVGNTMTAPEPFAHSKHPLAPLDDNSSPGPYRGYHSRGMSEPPPEAVADAEYEPEQTTPDKLLKRSASGSLGKSSRNVRPSKSSEFLRRLRASDGEEPPVPKLHYTPIVGDGQEDDEEERLRLPPGHRSGVRATNSPAKTLPTQATAPQDDRGMDLPPSMVQPVAFAPSNESSEISHAHQAAPRPRSGGPRPMPWPMAAKAAPSSPATSGPMPLRNSHSQNEALFAAETGGMVMLNNMTRKYSPGDAPGQAPASTRLPDYPPIPPYHRRSHRKSVGDVPFQRPLSDLQGHNRVMPSNVQPVISPSYPQPMFDPRPANLHHSSDGSSPRPDFTQMRPAPTPPLGSDSTIHARRGHARSNSDGDALLARQGTLFHPMSSDARQSQELDVMLGKPRSRRLSANALLPAPETPKKKKGDVRLEASKKSRARVELDVVIERECVIEGGEVRGRLEVVVHGGKRGNGLRVGAGKIRVIGYEELLDGSKSSRHIFYQQQMTLPQFSEELGEQKFSTLFADGPDGEGFRLAKEGTHALRFNMPLPVGGGAKGSFTGMHDKGPNVRYVVVGSVKLHIPKTGKRAIAHFYRPIVVLPYHNPARVLAPARSPLVEFTESGLGWSIMGEKGTVFLQVALGRHTWVAGQRVWCEVGVRNHSNKKINKCALAILQTVNTFGVPKGKKSAEFLSTTRRKVSEEVTEADFMDLGSGHVTSKSWWTGLEPGESNRWDMSVPIPTGMLSIPRSRLVEIGYILRVTLNNTIYVDVPLELINFLSIDPPPMPSDARRVTGRVPVTSPAAMAQADLEATSPRMASPQMGDGQFVPQTGPQMAQPLMMSAPVAETSPKPRDLPIVPPPAQIPPPGIAGPSAPQGLGYTIEQLRGEPQGMQAARSSSTTLNIEALLAQGRTRADGPAGTSPPTHEGRVTELTEEVTEDLNPRPISPTSKYSTLAASTINANARQLQHKPSQTFSEAPSIDDEERNYLAVEAHRREGRERSLAALEGQQLDDRSVDDHYVPSVDESSDVFPLAPEERGTYRPEDEPTGETLQFDSGSDLGVATGHTPNDVTPEATTNPTLEDAGAATDESEAEVDVVSEDDQTPLASPMSERHPVSKFLPHISEEEEPMTDDMLDDMVSLDDNGQQGRSLRYLDSTDDDDDDDDLVAADAGEGHDVTPRMSRTEGARPTLEDRLAMACGGAVVATASRAVSASAKSYSPRPSSKEWSPIPPTASQFATTEFGTRPDSVDYAEPLDIGTIGTMQSHMTMGSARSHYSEPDDGYDAMSERSSNADPSPSRLARHRHAHSEPFAWSRYGTSPPSLPPLPMQAATSGRTVSGRTVTLHDDDTTPGPSPQREYSEGRFGDRWDEAPANSRWDDAPGASPRSATFGTWPEPPYRPDMTHDHESRHLDVMATTNLTHDRERHNLASLAQEYDDDDDYEFEPPNALSQANTGLTNQHSNSSFHTAKSDMDDMPSLSATRRSLDSESSEDPFVESPPTQSQPVYTTPLPVPPGSSPMRRSLMIPDRFRPPQSAPPPPRSDDSHASTVSTSHDSVLPAVKARVAQFESREEALRKFTVASSAGLHSTTSLAPLSPTRSSSSGHGSGVSGSSASKRRSYTAALAPRMPGSYASPGSGGGLDLPHATGELSHVERAGTPTSVSSLRRSWEQRSEEGHELSGSASKLLSRALSTNSISTTATDMEQALSPRGMSPVPSSPRGPRGARHKPTLTINLQGVANRNSGSTVSTNRSSGSVVSNTTDADMRDLRLPSEVPEPTYRGSPAYTPTQVERPRLPDVMSETASLEEVASYDSHHARSTEDTSSGSEFGNTGWMPGASTRLPPLRGTTRPPVSGSAAALFGPRAARHIPLTLGAQEVLASPVMQDQPRMRRY